MISAHLIVSGRVQGVGFRATAHQKAGQLGVTGWVKNLANGNVELVAEGERSKVNKYIESIQYGLSPFIRVENVDVSISENTKGYASFEVKY